MEYILTRNGIRSNGSTGSPIDRLLVSRGVMPSRQREMVTSSLVLDHNPECLRLIGHVPSDEVVEFLLTFALNAQRRLLDPMCGRAWLFPHTERRGLPVHFNDILPVHYILNRAKASPELTGLFKSENARNSIRRKPVGSALDTGQLTNEGTGI